MEVFRVTLIALTIIMEARNQPELGKRMVAQVIVNRGGQEGVEQVVYEDHQFAVWGRDVYGPGHSLRLAVLECHARGAFPEDPWCIERWMAARAPHWHRKLVIGSGEYWEGVFQIAVEVYGGRWTPPPELCGKTHFDNPIFWPGELPPWMRDCVEVGDHVFCE